MVEAIRIAALNAEKRARFITEAVQVRGNHPLIVRPAEHDLRELVISRGESGYLAIYSYEEEYDVVLVLAIRYQREVGFT